MRALPAILILLTGAYTTPLVSAATLLLDYNFDGSSSSTASNAGSVTGAGLTYHNNANSVVNLYSAAGTGVSGATNDTALNNASAGAMGTAGNNPAGASTLAGTANVGTLGSFTITGWYNASIRPDNNAKLIELSGTHTIALLIEAGQSGQRLALNYDGALVANSFQQPGFSAIGSWVFFAVSYDGTTATNNLNFYYGTTSSAVILAGSRSLSTGLTGDLNLGSSVSVGVGNGVYNSGGANRPFDGLMDDTSLYGGAAGSSSGVLNLSQLDALRLQSVPEPATTVLLLSGGVLMAFRKRWLRNKPSVGC